MADAGTHRIKTENLCRFCGKTASSKKTSARPKEKFKLEFERHGVAIEADNDFVFIPLMFAWRAWGIFISWDGQSKNTLKGKLPIF